MEAAEILHTLSDQGFTLAVEGDRLTVSPSSRLTEPMRAEIRAHKPELVELLTQAANDAHTEPESSIERLERLNGEMRRALDHAHIAANAEAIGNALESSLIEGAEALAKTRPAQARHHTWLITLPTGERFSSMFDPPLSLAEIQARYPGATIEREPDPAPAPPLAPDALEIAYAYLRAIGETDLAAGQEFIEAVARDPEQLAALYVDVVKMGIADWPDDQATEPDSGIEITAQAVCARCAHWTPDRINPPGGLGRCAVAAPASKRIGSLWPGDGVIHCTQYQEAKP